MDDIGNAVINYALILDRVFVVDIMSLDTILPLYNLLVSLILFYNLA
jgi:hypothetical protein